MCAAARAEAIFSTLAHMPLYSRSKRKARDAVEDADDGAAAPESMTQSVKGPTSALTSFLQEHGISAAKIRENHWRRSTRESAAIDGMPIVLEVGDANPKNAIAAVSAHNDTMNLAATATGAAKKQTKRKGASSQMQDLRLMLPGLEEYEQRVPSLLDCCIRIVSEHVDASHLRSNPLSDAARDKLSRILSRKRRVCSDVLSLLYPPSKDSELAIYDATNMVAVDYFDMLQTCGASLVSLKLEFCGRITDDVIRMIGTHATSLRKLSLHGAYLVSDNAWEFLFNNLKCPLESLDLAHAAMLGPRAMSAIATRCSSSSAPSLTSLALVLCDGANDDSFEALIDSGALSILQKLVIRHPGPKFCHNKMLEKALNCCRESLVELRLEDCPNITDDAFQWQMNLRALELRDMSEITDAAVATLIPFPCEIPPRLKEFVVSRSRGVDNKSNGSKVLSNIIKEYKNSLEILELDHMNSLFDVEKEKHNSLSEIKKLKWLSVSWNDNIRAPALLSICQSTPLETLRVFGCNQLENDFALEELKNSHGKIVKVYGAQ